LLALGVFLLTAVLGGEVLARQRGARTRAEEAASSRMEALDTALRLQFVADALVSARTPQEVLDAVLVEGVRAADARAGLIATLSDDGEWLEVIASRGYDNTYIDPFRRFPLAGDYPLSEAVRTGEGVSSGGGGNATLASRAFTSTPQPGHALAPAAGRYSDPSAGSPSRLRPTRSSRRHARSSARAAGGARARGAHLASRSK
jgi:hypothetical protein